METAAVEDRLKILEVVHGFPPAVQGGAEIYAQAHALALARQFGDEIAVLTREQDPSRPDYSVRHEQRNGLSITWINNMFRATRSFEETYRNDAIGAIAARLIDRFTPDVAHVHHLTCLSTTIVEALAERSIPSFYTLHDYWLMCHRGQLLDVHNQRCDGPGVSGCDVCLGPAAGGGAPIFAAAAVGRAIEERLPRPAAGQLHRASRRVAAALTTTSENTRQAMARLEYMRSICSQITHFLAPSRHMRDRFVGFGIPAGRVTFSDYGFDHASFQHVARTSAPRVRFGFLGSLMLSKGPHLLLEAFARLPRGAASVKLYGAHVAYHGDDSYRSRLESLLVQPGIELHGPIAHDAVPETLAAIDVLVVPSVWEENSPLVIREAYLAGVPVVAARIGGIPELVEDGVNGLLFEPGDVDDLYRALMRVIDRPSVLESWRTALPPVRTIEDDVRFTRRLYETRQARAIGRTAARVRLGAIVLNYKTPIDTLLAVKSLLASHRRPDDIFVVDNDVGAGCRDALCEVADAITYVQTGHNLGFSGGMNVGIRAALARGAHAVLLVNSDAVLARDCIGLLEARLGDDAVGIVGPVLRSRSMPSAIASLGISYQSWWGRMRHVGAGEHRASIELPDRYQVDAVSGCIMLVKRSVFEQIGLLDEDYFFSFEDLDFCLKARARGFATVLASRATAYHEGGRSIGADSLRRLYFASRNHLLMARRTSNRRHRVLLPVVLASVVMLNVAHAVRAPGGSRTDRLRAVLRGAADYVAGRFGDRQ